MYEKDRRLEKAMREAKAIMDTEGFYISEDQLFVLFSTLEEKKEGYQYGKRFSQGYGRSLRHRGEQSSRIEE